MQIRCRTFAVLLCAWVGATCWLATMINFWARLDVDASQQAGIDQAREASRTERNTFWQGRVRSLEQRLVVAQQARLLHAGAAVPVAAAPCPSGASVSGARAAAVLPHQPPPPHPSPVELQPSTRRWLTIGIPTVSRSARHVDYLTPTLNALLRQLPEDRADPFFGAVKIVLMKSNAAEDHPAFDEAKRRWGPQSGSAKSVYIEFAENTVPYEDATPGDRDKQIDPNKPYWKVRKQTRDIAKMLEFAVKSTRATGRSAAGGHFLFMEDDFRLCPQGLRAVHYLIQKVHTVDPEWFAIRSSFGMNVSLLYSLSYREQEESRNGEKGGKGMDT